MSTDEPRPEDATNEPGGPAADGSVGPDPAREPIPAAAAPQPEPYTEAPAGPRTEPAPGPTAAGAGPELPPGQRPYPESGFFASIRRGLFPRSDQRWVGGVAGGVAERIGWDPLLVRGLLIVSFFLGGLGLILYGVGWALLPERDGRIHLQEAVRGNFDVAMLGSVAVFLTGFAWGGPLGWWGDGGWTMLLALFWIGLAVLALVLIVQAVQRNRDRKAAPQGAPDGPQGPGAPHGPGTPRGGPNAHGAAPYGPGPHSGPIPTPTPAPAQRPSGTSATTQFTPAPQVEYRRPDGLVRATGAGPAPRRQQPYAPQQYAAQGQQQGYGQYQDPRAAQRPNYTPPAPRRSRGPGGAAVGLSLGLILLLGAALLLGLHRGLLPADPIWSIAYWLGGGLVILGVAILVSGLRGRTSGWLGFFAIIGLIGGVTYVGVATTIGPDWAEDTVDTGQQIEYLMRDPDGRTTSITEGTTTARNIEQAERGYVVRWGDATIDLSEIDLEDTTPGEPVDVPVRVGAGSTTVLVPDKTAVEADVDLAAGVMTWYVDNQHQTVDSVNTSEYFASDDVGEDGAVLSLDIEAGAGEVVVREKGKTP